jgi:hypothetical protein
MSKFNDSYSYGTFRQHSYTSLNANLSSFESLLENKGVTKFVNFTLNSNSKILKKTTNYMSNRVTNQDKLITYNNVGLLSLLGIKNVHNMSIMNNKSFFNIMSFYPSIIGTFSNLSDSKTHSNSVKYSFLNKSIQKSFKNYKNTLKNMNLFSSYFYPSEILATNSNFKTLSTTNNETRLFKFKDLKSSNLQFLSSERNIRIPDPLKLNKNNFNFNT